MKTSEQNQIDATIETITITQHSEKRISVKFQDEFFTNANGVVVNNQYGFSLRKNGKWIMVNGDAELINYKRGS